MTIKFYVPDFFFQKDFQLHFLNIMRSNPEKFRDCKIAAYYGSFPNMIWNSGRVSFGPSLSKEEIENIFAEYNRQGIPLRITCTNPIVEEKHLHDAYCNAVLKICNEWHNEVIVNSPLLERYIRYTYLNCKIISSTTKDIRTIEQLNAELDKDYALVVPSFTFNNDWDELSRINHPEKCELLLNEICTPDCKTRAEHYKLLGKESLYLNVDKNSPVWSCPYQNTMGVNFLDNIKKNRAAIAVEDVYGIYKDAGFTNFKISGRHTMINTFDYIMMQYIYYMVKPEYYLYIIAELLCTQRDPNFNIDEI